MAFGIRRPLPLMLHYDRKYACCLFWVLARQVAEWPRSKWEIEDFCRGDVYGMGIVLWEIYTGAEPGFRLVASFQLQW